MALEAFLDIDGVEGESIKKGFEKKIELLDFAWGATQSATAHLGTGSGSGKANVQDFSFGKHLDKTSPILFQACLRGTHYKIATLTLRKVTGDEQLPYFKVVFEDCLVSSYQTGAGTGGDDQVHERMSLNFARFSVEYLVQDTKGGKAGKTTASWDIPKGTVLT